MNKKKYQKYNEVEITNILTKPLHELVRLYGKDRNHWQVLRRYYTKKLKQRRNEMERDPSAQQEGQQSHSRLDKIAELLERSGIDLDDVARINRVNVYQAAMKNDEGEFETQDLYSVQYVPKSTGEIYEPASPAKITPTKRKKSEKSYKQILVFGDSQIGYHRLYDEDGNDYLEPTHSEEALSILTQINAYERPDYVVNVSDTVDLAEFGRFDPQSDSFHRTLSPAFQRAHDLYAQLRADNPDTQLIEVDSNHTQRVHKAIMKKMPELYGMTLPGEEYPLMSYYRLANLGAIGVRFISGYGGAEYVHGEENGTPIVFRHGNHASSAPGTTIRKEAQQNPTTHVVRGHGHSYEHIAQTTRKGEVLHYIQLGTTCDTTGSVPSYHSSMDDFGKPVKRQENWQNQLLMVTDYEDGTYQFDVIDIISGIARYRGKEYNGNE